MSTTVPPLAEVLAAASVVSVPMRVTFRGVVVREAVLLQGPLGWGEFAPFVEYDDVEAASWLVGARSLVPVAVARLAQNAVMLSPMKNQVSSGIRSQISLA